MFAWLKVKFPQQEIRGQLPGGPSRGRSQVQMAASSLLLQGTQTANSQTAHQSLSPTFFSKPRLVLSWDSTATVKQAGAELCLLNASPPHPDTYPPTPPMVPTSLRILGKEEQMK